MIYAGIGSRNTPINVCNYMQKLGEAFAHKGFTLRSGNAAGADEAFIRGALKVKDSKMQIFLPWKNFGTLKNDNFIYDIPGEAFKMAKKFHPSWTKLSDGGKKLMARNVMQILGPSLDIPADFVICYTVDGKSSGGTGQALRMAEEFEISVYNLYHVEHFKWCNSQI